MVCNPFELENMEIGQLSNDKCTDIVQIHVPKGYTLPIELLNLNSSEWKDILNTAAKSHITTNYYNEPQIIEYYCMGQPNKIHYLSKYTLGKYHLDKSQDELTQDELTQDELTQDELIQSYKFLQCVIS